MPNVVLPVTTGPNSKGFTRADIMGKVCVTMWGPLSRFERQMYGALADREAWVGYCEAEAEIRALENPDGR